MAEKSTFTSKFGKILENINRPSYGMNTAIKNAIEASKGEADFQPIESFQRGFGLKDRTMGSDVLGELIGEQMSDAGTGEKIARGVAGFMVDVFADPTTYLGIGALTKLGKAAQIGKSAGKALKAESGVGKLLARVSPELRTLGETAEQQALKGQRSLLSLGGMPLGLRKVDAAAFKLMADAKGWMKNAPVLKQIIRAGEEVFKHKTGNKVFDKLMEQYHGQINSLGEGILTRAQSLNKAMKGFTKTQKDNVIEYIQKDGQIGKAISQAEIAAAEELKRYFGDIAAFETKKGVLKKTIDNYIPGIATEEGLKLVRSMGQKAGLTIKEISDKLDSSLPRILEGSVIPSEANMGLMRDLQKRNAKGMSEISTSLAANRAKVLTREMTPSQANALIRDVVRNKNIPIDQIQNDIVKTLSDEARKSLSGIQFQARLTGTKDIKAFFHTDPAVIAGTRAMSGVKAVAAKEFLDKVKKLGISEKDVKGLGDMEMQGFKRVNIPELEGKWFQPDVAKSLDRYHQSMTNNKVANEVIKNYKEAINWWKRYTLTIFPEYHVRNMVGNFFNNWITTGMSSPTWYIKAGAIAKDPTNVGILNRATGETIKGDQILKELKEFNTLGTGMFGVETAESFTKKLQNPSFNPASENFGLLRAGRKMGETFEDNAKIAHYIFQRSQGYEPYDAAMSVKKALFDYTALTDTEKNYLRFAFPFYSWSRNNIPLQLENLIKQPGKYVQLGKAKQEIENVQGTEDANLKWMPEWQQQAFPIILSRMPKDEAFKILLLTSWLPAGDIDKLFRPTEMITSSLEPFSKELLQQASGRDFFMNKDIADYPGEIDSFLGKDMPVEVKHGLKMFRLLNFIDQLNPNDVFGNRETKKPSFLGYKRRSIYIL